MSRAEQEKISGDIAEVKLVDRQKNNLQLFG